MAGEWDDVDAAAPAATAAASGLIAAYAQWHLERGIRSLAHVDRRRRTVTPKPYTHRDAVPYARRLDRAVPARVPEGAVPKHVAIVMDGNGRWANRRGLTRIEGHKAGEAALLDVVAGAIQAGVKHLSVYAFSTENWSRSPDEVRFLMGFNRDVLHRRRDQLNEWGVRVRWAGRKPRLWGSVIKELQYAEQLTHDNDVLTLTMCVNYGGRVELVDAMRSIADDVAAGRLQPVRGDREAHRSGGSTSPTCPTSICSSAPAASSAPRTSCCGSPRTPSSCSSTRCGRTSPARICGTRSASISTRSPLRRRGRHARAPPLCDGSGIVARARGLCLS